MMRHCKRIRVVSLVRATRVAAMASLAAVAVAATASPALAGTTHRGPWHAATALSTTGLVSIRHVILQAAIGGAAVMLLLTIGLLLLGRQSKAAVRPQPQAVPASEPSAGNGYSGTDHSDTDTGLAAAVPALADDHDQASGPGYTPQPPEAPEHSKPVEELAESGFPPAGLRVLGANQLRPGDDDMAAQRHQVTLGDDQIEVVLAGAQAPDHAALPSVRWAPLPYDVPEDGLAFACIGAGDEGCLFLDLAAAPGAVAITGDNDAAVRLAETIVHQLSTNAAADQAISVLLVGSCIPQPHPPNAISVQTLRDLAMASLDSPADSTDIVFCELRSNDDAFALARHVSSSRHRVIPVVLGHFPGTAWSFTASRLDDGALPSLGSSLTASPGPSR